MRIGVFGGTFDPIHKGHIDAAGVVLKAASLDAVLFMPTGDPPHKADRQVTPGKLRYKMVEAALKEVGNPKFSVSDMEISRSGYTYTIDTLRALAKQNPTHHYVWIIGADVLADLKHWKEYKQVFQLCSFAAMHRPGYHEDAFRVEYDALTEMGAQIQFVEVPPVDLSSTQIRDAVSRGQSTECWLPCAVAKIIEAQQLYREGAENWTIEQIKADLEGRLSSKRFAHSVRVMEEAVRIGKIVGFDPERCALAGLLHDGAREFTPSQYLWLGMDLEAEVRKRPFGGMEEILMHGQASALLATRRYGIKDEAILEAICCHTTGKPEMGILAQIVFVADYTEAGREGAHFDVTRNVLAEEGLLAAVVSECDMTIRHRMDTGRTVCIDTIETRNWALSQIK